MAHVKLTKYNGWRYRWVIFEKDVNKANMLSWSAYHGFTSELYFNPVRGLDSSSSVLTGNTNVRTAIKRSGDAGDVSSGICLLDGKLRYRNLLPITSEVKKIRVYANLDTRTDIRISSSSGSIINNYSIVDGIGNIIVNNVQYDQTININGFYDWGVTRHQEGWDYYHMFITRFQGAQYQKYWIQNVITIHDLILYL